MLNNITKGITTAVTETVTTVTETVTNPISNKNISETVTAPVNNSYSSSNNNIITDVIKGVTTAVTETVTAPINNSSGSSNKNITETVTATAPSNKNIITGITDTLTGAASTVVDGVSSSLLLDPSLLLSLTTLLSVAGSILQDLHQTVLANPAKFIEDFVITPLLRFLRPFIMLAISVILFLIGVAIMLMIIFSPLIIVLSPLWVPTAMVLLFVTAGLLITSLVVVAILFFSVPPLFTTLIQPFIPTF